MTVPQRRSGWPRVHLAMGFVVAVAVYLAADRYATTEVAAFLKDRRQALYAVLVSVHITMLGFALATLTVVLGYAQSPRFQVGVPVRMLSPAPNRDDLAVPRQCWRRRAGSWAAVIAATASAEG